MKEPNRLQVSVHRLLLYADKVMRFTLSILALFSTVAIAATVDNSTSTVARVSSVLEVTANKLAPVKCHCPCCISVYYLLCILWTLY